MQNLLKKCILWWLCYYFKSLWFFWCFAWLRIITEHKLIKKRNRMKYFANSDVSPTEKWYSESMWVDLQPVVTGLSTSWHVTVPGGPAVEWQSGADHGMSSCSFQHYFFSLCPGVHLPFMQLKSFPVEDVHFFHMKGVHILIIHFGGSPFCSLTRIACHVPIPPPQFRFLSLLACTITNALQLPPCFLIHPPSTHLPISGGTTSPPPAPFTFCFLASASLSSYVSCSSL